MIYKAVMHPEAIPLYLKERAGGAAYYWGDGLRAFNPTEIKLYVNNVCNARCIMCDIGLQNRDSVFYRQLVQTGNNVLSLENCRQLMGQVRSFSPKISISGVEPLLHPDILEIIRIIKNNGLFVGLSTNGILLPELAGGLIDAGPDWIAVSVDGPEPIHDQMRGQGVYRRVLEGLTLLGQHRTDRANKTIQISANCCITHLNYRNLTELADGLLGRALADRINFTHPYFVTAQASEIHNRYFTGLGSSTPSQVPAGELARIDLDALWEQIRQLTHNFPRSRVSFSLRLKSREQLAIYYNHPEQVLAAKKCLIPWKRATLLPNGDMVIHNRCFLYKAGNVFKTSFQEIWNGRRYRTFRRELKKAGLFPVCARCCGSLT